MSDMSSGCVYLMVMGAIFNRREINHMEHRGVRPGMLATFRRHLAADLWNVRAQLLKRGDVLSYKTFRTAYLNNTQEFTTQ